MKYIYTVAMLFLMLGIMAQEHIRIFVFSSDTGEPLAGATLYIEELNLSVQTSERGEYILPELSSEGKIHISYIGYNTKTIYFWELIKNPDIHLDKIEQTLDEVSISTGYQQISKERATGSYATVNKEVLDQTVHTDVLSKLDGVVPGILFNRSGNKSITVRGQSTLFSESNPLIVLDNFPYDGDILDINPNDIENVTVLKDAAAASIWGAQAANGVIVITTKKGKRNQKTEVDFSSSLSFMEKPDLFYRPRMSSKSFIEIEERLFGEGFYTQTEQSIYKDPYSPVIQLLIAERDGLLSSEEVHTEISKLKQTDVRDDFSKYLFQNALKQQYSLSFRGGGDQNQFYLSLGYDQNQEELVRNGMDRMTVTAKNTLYFLDNRLKFYTGLDLGKRINRSPNLGVVSLGMGGLPDLYPYALLVNEDGTYARTVKSHPLPFIDEAYEKGLLDWSYRPMEEIYLDDRSTKSLGYRLNAGINYTISKGLNADMLFQYGESHNQFRNLRSEDTYYTRNEINNLTTINEDGSLNRPIPLGGILSINDGKSHHLNFRTQLNYDGNLGKTHHVSALAGFEVRDNKSHSSSNRIYGYNDDLGIATNVDFVNTYSRYVDSRLKQAISNDEGMRELIDRHRSFYANFSYTYKDRYDLYGSARLDQSNIFGVRTNQKGVPLWSTGFAYQLSKEDFFNLDWLPYLKLKASYGYNGNINKSVSAFTTVRYEAHASRTRLPYARIVNPPNPELRWERVKVFNLGLDFETRNTILSGSLESYWKKGLDLIGETPYAPSSGVRTFTENYAHTKSTGIDIQLHSKNINRKVKWYSDFIFSIAKDEVTHYLQEVINFIASSASAIPMVGKPQYSIFSYAHNGLDPATGNPVGYVGGELSQDYTAIIADADENNIVYHGSARPTVFGSLRNKIIWKGFSLSANVVYRIGYYFRRNTVNLSSVLNAMNQHGDYEKRWQKPGDEKYTVIPSLPERSVSNRYNFYSNTGVFVEKGDHFRLQDINLSYSIPPSFLSRLPIRGAVFYLYMNNLGLLWKASKSGLDPDYPNSRYTPSRTIALGTNIKL